MDALQLFMNVYMCELEFYLNSHIYDIVNLSFQMDEANTDRPLKEYLKSVIQNGFNRITNRFTDINIVYPNGMVQKYLITDELRSIFIERVLLPDELTDDIKAELCLRKNAVFTKPDICLQINIGGEICYETIELKSTKNDSIPGSSVQQILPDEWVVFIKHNPRYLNHVTVTTGKYINAINSRIQFPDRSPRPQVSYSELENWNRAYRSVTPNQICINSSGDDAIKRELLNDWQGVLAKRWVETVFNFNKSKREPWFNNTLRKFIIEFLNKYEALDSNQREGIKALICSMIEDQQL